MNPCVFCEIVNGAIPARKVLETPDLLAFHDIRPQAPTHIQIIPKTHIPSINEADESHEALMGRLVLAARSIAADLGTARDGYRLVFNCGTNGGQEVSHIHLHLLAGRQLGWPPG
jgi:histidine triad (HIT) family protein